MEHIAIVTGANKGLGLATVKGLCEKFNGKVYLTSRDENRGLEAVKTLNKTGLHPVYHQLDVSNEDSVKEFARFIENRHGHIDILVNNAAILEWDEVYPTYDAAKRNIDINYKSLLLIVKYLFPLLRDGARVVNVSSACGLLSNLRNQKWIETLKKKDLTIEEINKFVDDYLDSVKNNTFDKNDFADDGKHAEHRVSKIALTALTLVLQKIYKNISINAVHPGHIKTDMANGGGSLETDDAAKGILYLLLKASPNLKGSFMWHDNKLIDWSNVTSQDYCQGLW